MRASLPSLLVATKLPRIISTIKLRPLIIQATSPSLGEIRAREAEGSVAKQIMPRDSCLVLCSRELSFPPNEKTKNMALTVPIIAKNPEICPGGNAFGQHELECVGTGCILLSYGNTEQLMHRHPGREILEKIIFDLHQLSKVDCDLQINFSKIFGSARAAQQSFSAFLKIIPNSTLNMFLTQIEKKERLVQEWQRLRRRKT